MFSETLGWKLKENYKGVWRELEWEVPYQTNAEGFRDTDHPVAKRPGDFRILVLSDSFGEGYGVRKEAMWQFQLERMFGPQTEVINFGVRGYDILQEYRQFSLVGMKYHPDLVIQVLNETDYDLEADAVLDTVRRFRPTYRMRNQALLWGKPPREGVSLIRPAAKRLKEILYRSVTLVWLRRQFEQADLGERFLRRLVWSFLGFRCENFSSNAPAKLDSEYVRFLPQAIRIVYKDLARLEREKGVKMVVVWVGNPSIDQPLQEDIQGTVGRLLSITIPQGARFRYDPHPNEEGHFYIADQIYRYLLKENLVPLNPK